MATLFQVSGPVFCVVCNDELEGPHRSTCRCAAGRSINPGLRTATSPRCGRVASHDETLAVVFLCQDCMTTGARHSNLELSLRA